MIFGTIQVSLSDLPFSHFWKLESCFHTFFLLSWLKMERLSLEKTSKAPRCWDLSQLCSLSVQLVCCSASLPLARYRWVRLTLSSLCPLFQAVLLIDISRSKRKILGNAKNQTWGCWVLSKYAASVLESLFVCLQPSTRSWRWGATSTSSSSSTPPDRSAAIF